MNIISKDINTIKMLNQVQVRLRLFKPGPNPTQIELGFRELESSATQVLKMFAQTHPNIGLGLGWVGPTLPSCTLILNNTYSGIILQYIL